MIEGGKVEAMKNVFTQILKDDAVKLLHSICHKIWKTQQWPQDWKRSVFITIPKKDNVKECSNYCTIALISHASKVMLKILHARLQQYMNGELPDIQDGFRKGRRKQKKIHRCTEKTFGLCGRRRGWDVLREQHQNMYNIKGETDHQPRSDA